jgi:Polyketide cyclase / dehydrase and lipid transport
MTSRRTRVVTATPATVWEVLSDGWLFPLWVVGASRMREVDDGWPAVGAKIHHSVGVWPLLLDDETEVVDCTPGVHLALNAKGRPYGEALVRLTLEPVGADTRIVIQEDVVRGPGALTPTVVRRPLLDWRNSESLRRLAYIVERRPAHQPVG